MTSADLGDPTVLVGTWVLHREIDDRYAGEHSVIDGQLWLAGESEDRLRWHESGRWHRPAGDVEVGRTLWLERLRHAW